MEPTTAEILEQQKHDISEDIIDRIINPMVIQAVDAALIRFQDQFSAAMVQARTDVTSATKDFATRAEVNEMGKQYAESISQPLRERLDEHLDNLNAEDARRYKAFEQRFEQINALAVESDKRTIENEKRIATHEATSEQRFAQLEKQIAVIRRDIDDNVKSVADSAKRMDTTFAKFIEKSEKRIDQIEADAKLAARNIKITDEAIEDIRDQRNDDVKELRRIEAIANTNDNVVRDLDNRVSLGMTNIQEALYGNKEKKKRSLIDDVAMLQQGLNWLTFFGTRRGMLLLGALYVAFLIVTAFILGRPEIVAAMIPAGSVKPG